MGGGASQSWMTGNTVELYDPTVALSMNPGTLPNGTPGVVYAGVTFTGAGGTGLVHNRSRVRQVAAGHDL